MMRSIIILILLLTNTQGLSQNFICDEYCHLPISQQLVNLVKYCKCSLDQNQGWSNYNTQAGPNNNNYYDIPYYYNPFENLNFYPPYQYYSNGTYNQLPLLQNPYYQSKISQNSIPDLRDVNSRTFDTDFQRKKSVQEDVTKTNFPLYFNNDISNTKNYELSRSGNHNTQFDKAADIKEKLLKECIDLHAQIIQSNNNEHTIKNAHTDLSDLELIVEISKKCNAVEAVLNEVDSEITTHQPIKSQIQKNTDNFPMPDQNDFNDLEAKYFQNTNISQNPKHSLSSNDLTSETELKLLEISGEMTTISTATVTQSASVTDGNTKIFHSKSIESILSAQNDHSPEAWNIVNEIELKRTKQEPNLRGETTAGTGVNEARILCTSRISQPTSFNVNPEAITNCEIETDKSKINDGEVTDLTQIKNIVPNIYHTNSEEIDNKYENIKDNVDKSSSDPQNIEEVYEKLEIVTVEHSDDTTRITKEIRDNEEIPRGSFIESLIKRMIEDHNSKTSLNDNISLKNGEKTMDNVHIIGKLYFQYRDNYIPAQLIQKSNGHRLNVIGT